MDENDQTTETSNETNVEKQNKLDNAKLAEQAERYDDMVSIMKEVAVMGVPLNTEERNLLSVAYKNVVGIRRSSWRVISSYIHKHHDDSSCASEYLTTIAEEIKKICDEVVDIIDNSLLKTAEDDSSKTFYLKMKGDYYRYVAEVAPGDERKEIGEKSGEAYESAYKICQENMHPTHPIRLGLALNYSVFYYEIVSDSSKACTIAKTAFDEAIKGMDNLSHSMFKDSSLILQLLRDNLALWQSGSPVADDLKQEETEEPTEE